MELNVQKQAVTINEVVFDSFAEHPLEYDVLLPDYCPDIVKILRCEVTSKVNSTQVTGERLTVEAVAVAKVFYMAEGMTVRCNEYKMPFTKTCDMKGQPQNPISSVTIQTNYVNCRAISQRRMEIRGAVTLRMKVISCAQEEMVADAQGMGIQLRKSAMEVRQITGKFEHAITLHEELEMEDNGVAIRNIIHYTSSVEVTDYKVITGKVITKGELHLHILYDGESETETVMELNRTVPVSQIVDCESVDEDDECFVTYEMATCDLQPNIDLDGETNALTLDALIHAQVTVHRRTDLTIVSDSYCTKYESVCQQKTVPVMDLQQIVNDTHEMKQTVELPENTQQVLDLWCQVEDIQSHVEENELCLNGKVTFCVLTKDMEGTIQCFDRSENFEHKIQLTGNCSSVMFDPVVHVMSLSHSMTGTDQMEICCMLHIGGCIYCVSRCSLLSAIEIHEDKVKTAVSDCAVMLYYADEGESVWEIAKGYNTDVDRIMEENGLENDQLHKRSMLLIPMV